MIDILIFTINAILPVIMLITLGYVLKQKGFLTKEFLKVANKAVFYIFLPVLLFMNIFNINGVEEINFTVIGYVICIVVLLFALGFIVTLFIKEKQDKGVVWQCVFRSNFALIGVSLAEMIGGASGVKSAALISAFSIPIYNIFAVIVLSVFTGKSTKDMGAQIKGIVLKIFKNPLIIGVVLGIIAALIKSVTPENIRIGISNNLGFITVFLSYLSRVASPLALIVLGGQFEFDRIKGMKNQIVISVLLRNFIAPLLGVGIAVILTKMGVLSFDEGTFAALTALFATPVAVSSAIMAEEMGNNGQLAAQLVVWTTVVSAFSLFIIIFALRLVSVI